VLVQTRKAGGAALETGGELIGLTRKVISKTTMLNVVTLALNVVIGSLSDYLIRWAVARQCLTIYPLRIFNKEFSAGINGHRGAVYGDPLGTIDARIQGALDWFTITSQQDLPGQTISFLASTFIPVVADLQEAGIQYRHPSLPTLDPR
jgi:hypothetical protein